MAEHKTRRLDKNRMTLKKGESQRKNGTYSFRWTAKDGTRQSVYAPTLSELREKEAEIAQDTRDGIKTGTKTTTLNDIFDLWCDTKRGLKDNTFQNYKYMYGMFVKNDLGQKRIANIQRSDVKRFYNKLADQNILKISTIDSIHTVLHQVFTVAVEDNFIRKNPSDNILKELKRSHNFGEQKKHALTMAEQKLFLRYLKYHPEYSHWYPVFAVMLGTGMRVGEVTGLRWQDIDMDNDIINVNHTLVYYRHDDNKCSFAIHNPKTHAGVRTIPMTEEVKKAFLMEREYQRETGLASSAVVDGYRDFIFINRFGDVQHQGTLNKAIKRIIRDCNDEVLGKGGKNPTLLPPFSCHSLRHTFTTRLCESGVNVKVIQDILGHTDIRTTLDIYADVTKELKQIEIRRFEHKLGDL